MDLERLQEQSLLHVHATRPHHFGLEMHLLTIQKMVVEVNPSTVIVDPVTNLVAVGSEDEAGAALTRMLDFFKERQITAVLTSLTSSRLEQEKTDVGISSIMDTWILLEMIENDGERNRGLYVLKSRGMSHSNQVREMKITERGIELLDVYLSEDGVLTGSARAVQEGRDRAARLRREYDLERRRKELDQKRRVLDARIAALRAEFDAEETVILELFHHDEAREALFSEARTRTAELRRDPVTGSLLSSGNNDPGPTR